MKPYSKAFRGRVLAACDEAGAPGVCPCSGFA